MQPHRSQCWLNPNIEDIGQFQAAVKEICEIYLCAEELSKESTHIYSTDEKMGIQAKEHANPKQHMKPGQPERVDPEYIRHGTSGIIASREIITGEIVAPMIQPRRTEGDYATHIESVISFHPKDKHIFVSFPFVSTKNPVRLLSLAGALACLRASVVICRPGHNLAESQSQMLRRCLFEPPQTA